MRWLIAAGGTGGHVFPAISVAAALQNRDPEADLLFVGTHRGLEKRMIPRHGYSLRTIYAAGLVGLGWRRQAKTLAAMPRTMMQCLAILFSFRPHLVLGMGGFAAGPIVFLAALLRIPSAIAEQNAVAGRTNRILGRVVQRVFLSFSESAGAFSPAKARVTGNPIRSELIERRSSVAPADWGARPDESFHLLIFGGSQGARGINRLMLEALPQLRRLPFAVEVIHQAGVQGNSDLTAAYHRAGLAHQVVAFIDDMARAYLWSHLVVCRAGATSLAEIAFFERPSLLIPYPHATDDHQFLNARVFQTAGAAVLYRESELDGGKLAEAIAHLAREPQRLGQMRCAAKTLARPEAADRIAEECWQLANRGRSMEGGVEEPPTIGESTARRPGNG
jgi:UDP-N-acetylglucosamine--N-acetylmuramyl-(pentapeptide) pyrophosphoryl-undecaprenol N-acetylglucosamine transferase